MESKVLSLIASFIALVFVVCSYFVRKKSMYLMFQALCIIFLIVSYFFNLQYFAMIGVTIGLCRTLTFFLFERNLHDLSEFTENLGGFMSNEERLLGTTNLSLTSMLFKLFSIFVPNISADNPVFSTTNLIIIVGIVLESVHLVCEAILMYLAEVEERLVCVE